MNLPKHIELSEDKDGAIILMNTDRTKEMLIKPSSGNSFKIIFVNRKELDSIRIPAKLEA